ncbi:MAG: short-chain dehydrogenase [Gammaproteobacteria bacterium HGW-Gammaproteobacteria-12]|uniref:NAD(P)-dependent dehydrogenase, short-chain alcohol dehydrogenase family n=1 Tax=Ectopseudomonas alcaliphila TaxID=101564 RepID=A0A1G7NBI0_9GAMM|nr:MAG: short-chain dehydrogenase [Gammaproteobacteria bacterium HGW-Gammaproteobacteria-12]SDF71312.1 NAD(P)-dependent dehydrogenase, short-chain alcohol dehydrogenase family [Pseudomonas alcaliphila]
MAVKRQILICGASRGLGLGLVRAFLDADWQVHAVVRELRPASPLEALRSQRANDLQVITCDLNRRDAWCTLAAALQDRRLDCALFNAGVYGPSHQDPRQAESEDIGQLFLANAVAPIRLAQQLAEHVVDGGVMAFMSSQMASLQLALAADMPLYGASKAALNSLLRSWQMQLPQLPWSLLALHPGWVRTDMGGDAAPLSVEQSASALHQVITGQLGRRECAFLDYQGQPLPW